MKWLSVAGVVVVAMTGACSGGHGSPSASTPAASNGCGSSAVDKWAAVAPVNPDEPNVRLPQPADWKRVNWQDLDNVRLMLRDDNLGKLLSPSVVVTIGESTGQATNPQAVIETERANLNKPGITDISDNAGQVCGFTATTFSYKSDRGVQAARSVRTVVIAPQYDNKLFDVVVTAQAGDADDQSFLNAAQTILTGMEIKAPH